MRWTIKASIGLAAGVLLLSGCYWSQPGFGPDNQSSNPAVRNLGPAQASTLHPVWSRSFGVAPTAPVESAGGRIHVTVNTAPGTSSVETLGERTGATQWRYVEPELGWLNELTAPVIVGSDLYVGYVGIHGSDMGKRYDPVTGAVVASDVAWGRASNRAGILASMRDETVTDWISFDFTIIDTTGAGRGWAPIQYGNRVIGSVVGPDAAFATFADQVGRFAYPVPPDDTPSDPFEGGVATQCTRASIQAAASFGFLGCDPLVKAAIAGASEPVLSSDHQTVYVTTPTTVYALAADDLSTTWTAAVTGGIVGPPTIAGDTLYVGTGDSLVAMPAAGCGSPTCAPSWSSPLAGKAVDRPTVAGGVVYVVARPTSATGGDVLEAFDVGCSSGCAPLLWTSTGLTVSDSPVVTTRSRLFLAGAAVGVDPSADEGRLVAYGPA